jgi:two-component system sensor histidine kinase RegB
MLRGLVIIVLAMVFALAWSHAISPLPVITVLVWLLLLWCPSLLFLITRRAKDRHQLRWLTLELCLDVLLFLGLLYQIGGTSNPIIFYLLLPVLIAALSLPLAGNILLATLAIAGYAVAGTWQQLPNSQHLHSLHDVSHTHEIGMWVIFVILVVMFSILGQAFQQANQRNQQQQAMALSLGLQRERMYQIAADLADRAHELNTPLTTLMLLTDDSPSPDPAQLEQDWQQIRSLTERMAAILKPPASQTNAAPRLLSELTNDLQKNLRMLAPTLKVVWHGPQDPLLNAPALWQRILANIGYNACDANATTVDIRCERDANFWLVQASDDGPRQHRDDDERAGLGIGLALIETSLAALGGSLELLFEAQWTVARIRLPITGDIR